MTNSFEQCTPPSIHDVYRGLPIGPGGVERFVLRDHGRHRRGPAHIPWRYLLLACKRVYRHLARLWQGMASYASETRSPWVAGARSFPGHCR